MCSEEFMRAHHLENNAVEIVAQSMVTDLPSSFDVKNKRYINYTSHHLSLLPSQQHSFINLCGYGLSRAACQKVYAESGLKAKDVDVLEVHFIS
mgnify:CR=1 FL=1